MTIIFFIKIKFCENFLLQYWVHIEVVQRPNHNGFKDDTQYINCSHMVRYDM